MYLKSLIANKLVKPFKAFPFFGRQRFWMLYWAYRLTGWHIRHKEWDFVLEYLPPLMKRQDISVLDVGCSRNLFCYEVKARDYKLFGVDLEFPNFNYPGEFHIRDITVGHNLFQDCFEFVTCISVLEHIKEHRDRALNNMIHALIIGGRLLITIPTKEFAQGHDWEGFTLKSLEDLLPRNSRVIEYTERAGQLCLSIERLS